MLLRADDRDRLLLSAVPGPDGLRLTVRLETTTPFYRAAGLEQEPVVGRASAAPATGLACRYAAGG